jgi:hypothetical protein
MQATFDLLLADVAAAMIPMTWEGCGTTGQCLGVCSIHSHGWVPCSCWLVQPALKNILAAVLFCVRVCQAALAQPVLSKLSTVVANKMHTGRHAAVPMLYSDSGCGMEV